MASKKDKQTKLKEDEFIIDVKQDIKPKTTQEEESNFIAETMKLSKEREKDTKKIGKEEKKEKKVKSVLKEPIKVHKEEKLEEKKEDFVKNIKEVEKEVEKDIEVRKIVKPSIPFPYKGIKKTADLLGQGFHYFVDMEYKITHDFLFGYLPEKIKRFLLSHGIF